jgi:hypothetical protein
MRTRTRFPMKLSLIVAGITLAGGMMTSQDASAQERPRTVVINRVTIPPDTLRLLEQRFGTGIPDGRYWYDNMTGAWGVEGGPTAGFTLAGLSLGGPLRADASSGNTGVFINGRELHALDVLGLQRIVGVVYQGRYWVNAQGIGGIEGGPPMFDLRAMAAQSSRLWKGSGAGVGEDYGGGAWAYGNSNTGIGVISDGEGGMMVFDH